MVRLDGDRMMLDPVYSLFKTLEARVVLLDRTTQNPKPVPAAGAAIPITTVVKGVPSQVS